MQTTTNTAVLNAGITVQILLDVFDIRGIVHYGIAGSANNSLSFGDVSVPKYLAFTGSWTWMNFESEEKGEFTEMKFGDYNLPKEGENLLAKVEFKTEELYSVGQPMKEVFWLEVDQTWFNLAAQLQDLELQQCVNETYCLPKIPRVEYGLRGSTADIFVDNAAYRKFLFEKFQVSTIDEESAAVVMTAMSSGVPCIVFRGVSDLAGGGGENDKLKLSSSSMFLGSLASINDIFSNGVGDGGEWGGGDGDGGGGFSFWVRDDGGGRDWSW
ncbi:Nucleoside phosphorylase domain [Macleaya cordata]|uniref:Nucleoside phosphorylase domain n=1 Tax=Macleaya cordata TaxID=56857 RepID=A0A200PXB7_MACCD|nr:Nucleoside phosphorylase domain [Macleaya cordata]